mmetsp:Transcript_9390/g.9450  ORF Transcript_9390/g.9450 Transcript_9390/m.9450 type:complete len:134 (-) Transcript_9390:83-484(-)
MVSEYSQTVDNLNVPSRNFYEWAKFKQTMALFLSGIGMMFLGFGSQKAGQAQSKAFLIKEFTGTDLEMDKELAAGYGFATFCFILACVLTLAMAMYISPYSCGSTNEKKILMYPGDIYSSGSNRERYVQPQSI